MTTIDATVCAAIEKALRAATRAPSPHNSQPWRFVVTGAVIEVHLDRERVLTVADPGAREARMSCAAALFNLRVTLEAAGRGVVTDLLPDPGRPDLLAALRITGARPATPEQRSLAGAVERRATSRRPLRDRPVPPAHRDALVRAAEAERAHLVPLGTRGTHTALGAFAAALLRRAGHVRKGGPGYRREPCDRTRGGGPRSAGEGPFGRDPLVVVLTTSGDSPRDHLHAGLAMQRVLLAATVRGLSAAFLTQPAEVAHTRSELNAVVAGRGYPQITLRIGYGHPAARTPRRPASAVTSYAGSRVPA